MTTIIATVISSVLTLLGVIITVRSSEHKRDIEQAKRDQKIDDEIRQIKDKLDTHNGYAEKLTDITITVAEMRRDISYIKENKR